MSNSPNKQNWDVAQEVKCFDTIATNFTGKWSANETASSRLSQEYCGLTGPQQIALLQALRVDGQWTQIPNGDGQTIGIGNNPNYLFVSTICDK